MSQLLLIAPLALCGGAIALFLFRASPRGTFVVWMLVLCFVPVWVGASVGFFWAAITLVTVAAILANLADLQLSWVDGLVVSLAILVLALFALRAATLSATVIALLEWLLPYVWGRLVLARVPGGFIVRTIAAVATAVAVLALVEFATGTNLFVLIPGANGSIWGTLQPRASFLRVEGAFGHSIALGASLAMATVFIIGSRWRTPVMLVSLAVVVGAIVVTFSRIGLITAALAIAMSIVLLPGVTRTVRWGITIAGAAAVALIVPFLGDVFVDAGDEAGGSAAYRARLLSLATQVELLGSAGDWSGRMIDGVYLGDFARSVDNTLLLIALRFGWIPVLLVVGIFVAVLLGLVRGRSNPAAIAVVSQLPALVAVALITQFGMFLWFLVGLSVSWRIATTHAALAPVPRSLSARHPRHAALLHRAGG